MGVTADVADFGPVPENLTYVDSSDRVLQIPIKQDREEEEDETFSVSLTIPLESPYVEAAEHSSVIGITIVDDDGIRGMNEKTFHYAEAIYIKTRQSGKIRGIWYTKGKRSHLKLIILYAIILKKCNHWG